MIFSTFVLWFALVDDVYSIIWFTDKKLISLVSVALSKTECKYLLNPFPDVKSPLLLNISNLSAKPLQFLLPLSLTKLKNIFLNSLLTFGGNVLSVSKSPIFG